MPPRTQGSTVPVSNIPDTAAYRARIKEQICNTFSENGLVLSSKRYRRLFDKQFYHGERIWKHLQTTLLQDTLQTSFPKNSPRLPPYFIYFPRTCAFGYAVGAALHRALNASPYHLAEVASTNALFNAAIPLFDSICDDEIELLPALVNTISKPKILKALDPLSNHPIRFPTDDHDVLIIQIMARLTEAYFARCRALFQRSAIDFVWDEFAHTILTLYEAELKSTTLHVGKAEEKKKIYITLQQKSALPFWAMAFPCLFAGDVVEYDTFLHLKQYMLMIGDIFWIMDDLVDLEEDLLQNKWSYVWYQFVFKHNHQFLDVHGKKKPIVRLLDEIIESNTVTHAAQQLCQHFNELETMGDVLKNDSKPLRLLILVWLYNWIEAL